MTNQRTWRVLSAVYGGVAAIQLYIAISMDVTWAGVLCVLAAGASAAALAAARRRPEPEEVPEPPKRPSRELADRVLSR